MIYKPLNDRDYVSLNTVGAVVSTTFDNLSQIVDNVLVQPASIKIGNMQGTFTINLFVDGVPVTVPKRSELFLNFTTPPHTIIVSKNAGDVSSTDISIYGGVPSATKQTGKRNADNKI